MNLKAENFKSKYIVILRWACFFIFAGRAWQHLFWDAPFRALFWDQEWMQGTIESITGLTWDEYATSTKAESIIQFVIRTTGWLYVLCALISLFVKQQHKFAGKFLWLGAASLLFLGFLNCKEKFFQMGEFMEHAIQITAPVLLFLVLFKNIKNNRLIIFSKIAIALTFAGHGLYAVNYYPQPGPYVDMMLNIFHFNEETAKSIIVIMGILDFIVSIFIFIPITSSIALLYCAAWGLLTALARVTAGFDTNFPLETLNQYTFETVFRLSHFMIPLWVFYINEKGLKKYFSKIFFRNREIILLQTEKNEQ